MPSGEKYAGPDSEKIVVIEVLSVFRSKLSISCPASFNSPLWHSSTKSSSTCSLAPFSSSLELRCSPSIGVVRCFASAMFFLGGIPVSFLSRGLDVALRSLSGGGYPTCTVQSNRPLRKLTIHLPAQCSGGPSSFIRREKISTPADEFVHGPLFHPK